jgi:putative ABC transport system permease protein
LKELNLFNLAWQNLRRKPYRTVVLVLCVAVATGSLFAATLVLRSVHTSLAVGQARLGADLVVVPLGYEISAQEAFITGQATEFYMDGQARKSLLYPGFSKPQLKSLFRP